MESESGFTGSITDELHPSDIELDRTECESGVTRSIIDELRSFNIQGE